jgi:hypothetical protein
MRYIITFFIAVKVELVPGWPKDSLRFAELAAFLVSTAFRIHLSTSYTDLFDALTKQQIMSAMIERQGSSKQKDPRNQGGDHACNPSCRRWGQKDREVKASLGLVLRLYLKKQEQQQKKTTVNEKQRGTSVSK